MAKIDGLLMDIDIDKVSDIHITSGAKPMVRIDGNLVDVCEEIISHSVVEEYIKDLAPDRYEEFLENGEIDFVGVTTGTTTQEDFEKYNNIKIVNNLSSILEVV